MLNKTLLKKSHMLQVYSEKKITQQTLLYLYLLVEVCGGSNSSFISWSVSVSYLITSCSKILSPARNYTLTNHSADSVFLAACKLRGNIEMDLGIRLLHGCEFN
jgi:hypothetical protein